MEQNSDGNMTYSMPELHNQEMNGDTNICKPDETDTHRDENLLDKNDHGVLSLNN